MSKQIVPVRVVLLRSQTYSVRTGNMLPDHQRVQHMRGYMWKCEHGCYACTGKRSMLTTHSASAVTTQV